jgi:hypothetical protein
MYCNPYYKQTHKMKHEAKPKRSIQTFEPCGPVLEMLVLEMNNRTRGRKNKRGEKVKMFEDIIVAQLGGKYPKLRERFELLRKEAA